MTNSPSPEELALLPCPFCGGEAQLYEGHLDHWKAGCEDCGAATGSWHKGAKAQAAATWNTRTIEPPLDGEPCPYCKGRGGWTGETKWAEQDADCDGCDGTGIAPTPLDGEGVIQADRDRVADYWMPPPEDQEDHLPWVRRADAARAGKMDDDALVQAFAAHRRAATISTPREDEVERVIAASRAQIAELLADAKGKRQMAEDLNTPEELEEGLLETARIEEDSADMLHSLVVALATLTPRSASTPEGERP